MADRSRGMLAEILVGCGTFAAARVWRHLPLGASPLDRCKSRFLALVVVGSLCAPLAAADLDDSLVAAKSALGQEYGSIRTLRIEYDYVSVLKPESRQPKEKIGKPNALRMAYWLAGERRRLDQVVPDGEFEGKPGFVVSYDGSRTYVAYFKDAAHGLRMGQLHIFPGLRNDFCAMWNPTCSFGIELPGMSDSFRKLLDQVGRETTAVVALQPPGLLRASWQGVLHQHEGVRYRYEAEFDPSLGWLPRTIWRTPEVSHNPQIGGPEAFRATLRNLEFARFRDALTGQMRLFPVKSHLDYQPFTVEISVRQVAINEPLAAEVFSLRPEPGVEVSVSPERAGQPGQRYIEGAGEIQDALVEQAARSLRGDSGIVHDASPRYNRWYHWLGWFSGTVLLLVAAARLVRRWTRGNS